MINIDFIEIMKTQIQSCLEAMDYRLKHAKFDRTFKAQITRKITEGKYEIYHKNKYYTASSGNNLQTGATVLVCAPENNWSELFVCASDTLQKPVNQLHEELHSVFNKDHPPEVPDFHVTPHEFVNLQPMYHFTPASSNGTGGWGIAIPMRVITWRYWIAITTGGELFIKRQINDDPWTGWSLIGPR